MILNISSASAGYQKRSGAAVTAVNDISLSAEPGDTIAICGHSGCGKSTILSVAGGMLRPKSGTVKFDGVSIYDLDDTELSALRAKKVGFLFQMDYLLSNYDIAENIRMSLYYSGTSNEERIDEVLEVVGLRHRARHLPDEMSGGERHRAALARAVAHRPDIILADEPTGNLDRENANKVLELLLRERDRGAIVVVATHDHWVADRLSKRILLADGKIVG